MRYVQRLQKDTETGRKKYQRGQYKMTSDDPDNVDCALACLFLIAIAIIIISSATGMILTRI